MLRWFKRLFWLSLVAGIVAAVVYGFMPKPIPVDVARVSTGSLSITVNEDGKTRVRNRYIISAPLAGRLHRIQVRPGDPVAVPENADWATPPVATSLNADEERDSANGNGSNSRRPPRAFRDIEPAVFASPSGRTEPFRELAIIDPVDPGLLDARQITQAEMRVKALESAIKNSAAGRQRAVVAVEWAQSDLDRRKGLTGKGASTKQDIEEAEFLLRSRLEELNVAKFSEDTARYELEFARAALLRSKPLAPEAADKWRLRVTSPINGVVLRVMQESAAVVQVGTPLLEVGDPRDLEIEIDVLSTDAVKIETGQPVWLEQWGGDRPLVAHVKTVEPSGFLKISALGVEEQRVHVIANFDEPFEARKSLGDGYRVEAKIVIWAENDVVKIPTGALFRVGEEWFAFVIDQGRANKCPVKIGRRNGLEARVIEGLSPNDTVIVHPSDRIQDQTAVRLR